MRIRTMALLVLGLLLGAPTVRGAELVLPQNRNAFYTEEPIEVAVAGLKNGATATVQLVPQKPGPAPVQFTLTGDGSTVAAALPAGTLAPGGYTIRLDGKDAVRLTVASGVNLSSMLLSQTTNNPRQGGANFLLGSAFSFGLLDGKGQPSPDVRGRRSAGMQAFENAVAADLPTIVYMYWTGYVTHKPFGSEKSWANRDVIAMTRLLNFHTAQRLRRYGRNIHAVGTLDEPGLSWGRTAGGGMASGFANWDSKPWYAQRGWDFTADPGARPAAGWMKYLAIRCGIIKEVNAQAKKDLKTVWPKVVFSTDLYAPQAIMDGTDPFNQQVNDVPASHVFLDWGIGRSGALSGIYLEKAHDPVAHLAHAMNGQLMGAPVPQPQQRYTYRLMLNAMLAAGLHSNWWLNPTAMTPADLKAVNEPGLRWGPLFKEMAPRGHDVAVLWSFTEIAMREKDVARREARKKTGEQIKLLIASLPESAGVKDGEVVVNAYNVGGNYKEQVINAHAALTRAGYPAHILHERILPHGVLKDYRILVVVGQTFDLPADVRRAIDDFTGKGGRVVVDGTTKVKFPATILTKADFRDPGFRWSVPFERAQKKDHGFPNDREASFHLTNAFMDGPIRKAAPHLKAVLKETKARPALETDSVDLLGEKHSAGEGSLYLVLNAHEELPQIPPGQKYHLYNYAPYTASYSLRGIAPGSTVYCVEGGDWDTVRAVTDFDRAQKGTFAPGEMKLYLVAPRRPVGLTAEVSAGKHALEIRAGLKGVKMPWPLIVTVTGPDGKDLYRVHRATGADGVFRERFPVGANAPGGTYRVTVASLVGGLSAQAQANVKASTIRPQPLTARVRVFDREAIVRFLAGRPEVVIALGSAGYRDAADRLQKELSRHGVKASVRPEGEVFRKARYPRVWNPYATVYHARGPEKKPVGMAVKTELRAGVRTSGALAVTRPDGKSAGDDWKQPGALVTITGAGLVDYGGDRELCFEPGVKLYFNERRQMQVVRGEAQEEQTTAAFRSRWEKPWARLTSHVGAYQLPPSLPEAYTTDHHLILLGDSRSGTAVAALQASELLPQAADARYPGPGKALVSFAWSPFGVEKNVLLVGAADRAGVEAGAARLAELAGGK